MAEQRRGPGRPSKATKADELAGTIEHGLKGLAALLERQEELEDVDGIAAIIKRDARVQAEWLAALADNHGGAEKVLLTLFGAGSLIGAAGAFGPLASRLIDRARLSGLFDWSLGAEPEPDPGSPPEPPEGGYGEPS